MITANRLTAGVVVWLDAAENWSERLEDAAVFAEEDVAASVEMVIR